MVSTRAPDHSEFVCNRGRKSIMCRRRRLVVNLILINLFVWRNVSMCVCEDFQRPNPTMIEALMQLELVDLLRVKRNWQMFHCECENQNCKKDSNTEDEYPDQIEKSFKDNPEALPLIGEKRSGSDVWVDEEDEQEERPSKIQTIFNVSITGLALLSFGAYLLCLIVQVIKSKGATYFHPVASEIPNKIVPNKIKFFRRNKRQTKDGKRGNISGAHQATRDDKDNKEIVTDGTDDTSRDSDAHVEQDEEEDIGAANEEVDDSDDHEWGSGDMFEDLQSFAKTFIRIDEIVAS